MTEKVGTWLTLAMGFFVGFFILQTSFRFTAQGLWSTLAQMNEEVTLEHQITPGPSTQHTQAFVKTDMQDISHPIRLSRISY